MSFKTPQYLGDPSDTRETEDLLNGLGVVMPEAVQRGIELLGGKRVSDGFYRVVRAARFATYATDGDLLDGVEHAISNAISNVEWVDTPEGQEATRLLAFGTLS